MAAIRTNGSYLQALYRRKKTALGHGRALGAVKHSIICACWHMLSTGELYNDLGGDYYTRRDPERQTRRLIAQLQRLGHIVTLQEAEAAQGSSEFSLQGSSEFSLQGSSEFSLQGSSEFSLQDIQVVEAEHRDHAVVEQVIADLKDQALAHFPSGHFHANGAWTVLAAIAHNLLRWTQLLGLPDTTIRAARTLRRRLLQIPGRLTSHARGWTLNLPARWPWHSDYITALNAIRALPAA